MSIALTVREATDTDIAAVVAMGPEFFAMSPYAAITTYDGASTAATLAGIIDSKLATLIVAAMGAEIVGFIFGMLSPMYFNLSYIVAIESAWYVTPAHRNGRAGLSLLWAFEDWAVQSGAKAVLMSALTTNRAVLATYLKTGYKPVESSHIKVF